MILGSAKGLSLVYKEMYDPKFSDAHYKLVSISECDRDHFHLYHWGNALQLIVGVLILDEF